MTTKFRSALLIGGTLLAVLASSAAIAQWGWTDKDGRRIFSDQAPGSEILDKSIFKRPAGSKAPAAPAEAVTPVANAAATGAATAASGAASSPRAAASGLRISGKDSELEKKKKEAEGEEAKKKKAEDTKIAEARADNCERAKRAVAQFNSGVRIATTNAKGEREIMSDTDRAAETKRLQGVVSSDCK